MDQVLQAKVRRQQDLKRKLGITQLDEFKADVNVTLKTISESDAFIKTSTTLKTAGQKTGEALTVAGQKTGEVLGSAGSRLLGEKLCISESATLTVYRPNKKHHCPLHQ